MKKFYLFSFIVYSFFAFSQAPNQISYQGVARNTSGTVISNQPIGVKFDIHQGTASGTIVFSENHTGITTNNFGLFTTYIGSINNLAVINWANGPYFVEVSIDPNTGTYSSLGTQQLMSVPYALYAASAPAPSVSYTNNVLSVGGNTATINSGTTYTAGNGIDITGGIISNTATAVTPTIVGTGATTVTGTYPNLTVNTPTLSLQGAGNATVTGAFPNYTVNVPSSGSSLPNALSGQFLYNTGTVWDTLPRNNLYFDGSNFGIGTTTPQATFHVNGDGKFNSSVTTPQIYTNNFQMTATLPNGKVLTSDALGNGTWQDLPVQTLTLTGNVLQSGPSTNTVNLSNISGLWSAPTATSIVTTNSTSLVGIGTNTPAYKLDVYGTGAVPASIHGYNSGATVSSTGVFGENPNNGIGVYGQSNTGAGVWGKSTTGAGMYGESTSGDGGKFILPSNTTTASAVNAQTNGTGVALFAKSYNANPLAAKFEGGTEIFHSASVTNPHLNFSTPSGTYSRIKYSNIGQSSFFSTEVINDGSGNNEAYSISHFNGVNTKQVLLINGQRMVYVNALNYPLAAFHVMTSTATAVNGIVSEGFSQPGQIIISRNNQITTTRLGVIASDEIGRLVFGGCNNAGNYIGNSSKISVRATEAFSSTSQGSEMLFSTVKLGTIASLDAMKLTDNGDVVINPNGTINTALLNVKGKIRIDSNLTMAGYPTTPVVSPNNEGRIYYDRPSQKFKVSENGAAYIDLIPSVGMGPWVQAASTVTLANITNSVGIGTATPASKLEVVTNGSLIDGLRITNTSTSTAGPGFYLDGNNQDWTITGTNAGSSAGANKFVIRDFTAAIDRFTIDNTGRIGMGITNPSAALHVRNNATALDGLNLEISNSGNGNNGLQLTHNGTGNAAYFQINNTSSNAKIIDAVSNGNGIGISAVITNTASTADLVNATQYGRGNAGFFQILNANNPAKGIEVSTNGNGAAFGASTTGLSNAGIFSISNNVNNSAAIFANTNGSGNAIYATNSSSTMATVHFENTGNYDGVRAISAGGRAIYAQSNSGGDATAEFNNMNSGNSINAYKSGTATGITANFANNNAANSADVLFVNNVGAGAAIHAVSGPTVTGGSNNALWLEGGHLKSTQAAVPTASTVTTSISFSSATYTLTNATDVKGTLLAVTTTTSGLSVYSNSTISIRVTFNKQYQAAPTVVITPMTDMAGLSHFVSSVSPTSFVITIKNSSGATINASSLTYQFNYMVIE
jgi:hypothetical protein